MYNVITVLKKFPVWMVTFEIIPGKEITTGMAISPATTFLTVSANTASRDILDGNNCVCQILPWITDIKQNDGRATLCLATSRRQLGENQ